MCSTTLAPEPLHGPASPTALESACAPQRSHQTTDPLSIREWPGPMANPASAKSWTVWAHFCTADPGTCFPQVLPTTPTAYGSKCIATLSAATFATPGRSHALLAQPACTALSPCAWSVRLCPSLLCGDALLHPRPSFWMRWSPGTGSVGGDWLSP